MCPLRPRVRVRSVVCQSRVRPCRTYSSIAADETTAVSGVDAELREEAGISLSRATSGRQSSSSSSSSSRRQRRAVSAGGAAKALMVGAGMRTACTTTAACACTLRASSLHPRLEAGHRHGAAGSGQPAQRAAPCPSPARAVASASSSQRPSALPVSGCSSTDLDHHFVCVCVLLCFQCKRTEGGCSRGERPEASGQRDEDETHR